MHITIETTNIEEIEGATEQTYEQNQGMELRM